MAVSNYMYAGIKKTSRIISHALIVYTLQV